MRSNEELAILAKEQENGAMAELWEQTCRLMYKLLGKYYPLCPRCGLDPEDLKQSTYFALVRAVNAYDPDRGFAFTSYLQYHVTNTAREALGFKNSRRTLPPLVKSLDKPLPGVEDESLTLADTIPDETAEAAFERVHEDWQRRQFRDCLDDCMESMPPELANTIRARFFEGKALQAIAGEQNTSREHVRQLEAQGLRKLRLHKTPRCSMRSCVRKIVKVTA